MASWKQHGKKIGVDQHFCIVLNAENTQVDDHLNRPWYVVYLGRIVSAVVEQFSNS